MAMANATDMVTDMGKKLGNKMNIVPLEYSFNQVLYLLYIRLNTYKFD